MNLMREKEIIVQGLCCFGFMKLETGAFLVVYIDLACLIGLLAYVAACIMIYCCSFYDFLWSLLCIFQSALCIILFQAIQNRILSLLKVYILLGFIGRTLIFIIWAFLIVASGIVSNVPFTDSQLIIIGILFIFFAVNILCGLLLLQCHTYYKRLFKEANKVKKIRHMNLCPHLDYKHREDSGLLSTQFLPETGNERGFLLHELDLERLQKSSLFKIKI